MMSVTDLKPELSVPLKWVQSSAVNRGAMALITVSNDSGEKSVLVSNKGLMVVDSKNYVLAPTERIKTNKNPIRNALTLGYKVTGWVLVAFLVSFSVLNLAGVVKSQIVLTGSMSPAINPGDMVISVSPLRVSPEIGDVVVYAGKRLDGSKVASYAHRIIGGDVKNGFIVKGDNNPDADTQRPVISEIEGVVLFSVPFVGKILSPQIFVLILLCAFGLWLIVDAFRDEE